MGIEILYQGFFVEPPMPVPEPVSGNLILAYQFIQILLGDG